MKISIVYTAAVLSSTALAAIGGGYEHGEHGSTTVSVDSSTISVGSSTATEVVISTEINSPTGASEVVSEGTTRISVTVSSAVIETATGIPGTARQSQKSTETVTSYVVSETTASVVSTVSSESSASSSAVVSTETNEAVTGSSSIGGSSTSTGSSSEVDSTVRLTSTVVVTSALPILSKTISSTAISMDTQPIPATSTLISETTTTLPPATVMTTDVIETTSVVTTQVTSETAISTSTSEEVEVPSTISTSTSIYTVVVTGSTSYNTVTLTLSFKPTTTSKVLSVSTTAVECKPSTVYITVSKPRTAGRRTSNPPLTPIKSSTVTSSAIKTMSSAPYSMINSTQLNSGVGATGIPQNYKNSTVSATGTGGLTYTSATIPAQPTFTGAAAIVSNQTYKALVAIVAGVAVLARLI